MQSEPRPSEQIHREARVRYAGAALSEARAAVLLLHGRGGSADDILGLTRFLPSGPVAYLAPEAHGNSWYPYSFLSPIERNQPSLSSALQTVGELLAAIEAKGIPKQQIVLAGFSQGACLALTYAVRRPARYGGVVGLSGGLIGPPGTEWPQEGDFAGTSVFLGCSDIDAHIPRERVAESAAVFTRMGGSVVERIYPGMGHTINEEELESFGRIVSEAVKRA